MTRKRLLLITALCGLLAGCRPNNPFEGLWYEVGQISCEGGTEITPRVPIEEIDFQRNRQVWVTWIAFESYYDYRARYAFDPKSMSLTITQFERINYLPPAVDGVGTYRFDDAGRLILEDIYLGASQADPTPVTVCGHIFEAIN